jgi:hypothetical protein
MLCETLDLLKSAGAIDIQHRIGKHIIVTARHCGRPVRVVLSWSPSCHRARAQNLAVVRRQLRAAEGTTEPTDLPEQNLSGLLPAFFAAIVVATSLQPHLFAPAKMLLVQLPNASLGE